MSVHPDKQVSHTDFANKVRSGLGLEEKSEEEDPGEQKRRLSEQSKFLRFHRERLRSRLKTGTGVFPSYCLIRLDNPKKK